MGGIFTIFVQTLWDTERINKETRERNHGNNAFDTENIWFLFMTHSKSIHLSVQLRSAHSTFRRNKKKWHYPYGILAILGILAGLTFPKSNISLTDTLHFVNFLCFDVTLSFPVVQADTHTKYMTFWRP